MSVNWIKSFIVSLVVLVLVAPLKIEVSGAMLTLQTFVITTASIIFGFPALGAILVYIGLGLLGAPTWSGYHIDPHILQSDSVGFIVGFVALSLFMISVRSSAQTISGAVIYSLVGHAVLLVIAQVVCEILERGTEIIPENLTLFITGSMIKSTLVALVIYIINRVKPDILAEDE